MVFFTFSYFKERYSISYTSLNILTRNTENG